MNVTSREKVSDIRHTYLYCKMIAIAQQLKNEQLRTVGHSEYVRRCRCRDPLQFCPFDMNPLRNALRPSLNPSAHVCERVSPLRRVLHD